MSLNKCLPLKHEKKSAVIEKSGGYLQVGHYNDFLAPGGGNLNKPVFKTAKRPEVAMGVGGGGGGGEG